MTADRQAPASPPADRLCLSVAEAADALRVSSRQVYNLAARYGLPTVKLGGRRLVRVDDLRRWVEAQPVAMFEEKEGKPPSPDRTDSPSTEGSA